MLKKKSNQDLKLTKKNNLMQTNNKQKNDLSQQSLGFRIWIYFCCILINIAVAIFLIVSKLIIIILWPFVRLSLLLEYLNLKLKTTILEENLKNLSEVESDSRTWKTNSKSIVKFWYCVITYSIVNKTSWDLYMWHTNSGDRTLEDAEALWGFVYELADGVGVEVFDLLT